MSEKPKNNLFILIATPAYGGNLQVGYTKSLIALLEEFVKNDIKYELFMPDSESLITRARNAACAVFLSKPFTHLLFIDSDIIFPVHAVIALLNAGYPISAVPYPIKKFKLSKLKTLDLENMTDTELKLHMIERYCLDLEDPITRTEGYFPKFDTSGFCKVNSVGTGFLMIKKDVINTMIQTATKYLNDAEGYDSYGPTVKNFFYNLFDTMIHPVTKRYLSEDYAFCHKAREQGFDIWINPHIILSHIGNYTFTGHFWTTYQFRNKKTGDRIYTTYKTVLDDGEVKKEIAPAASSIKPEKPPRKKPAKKKRGRVLKSDPSFSELLKEIEEQARREKELYEEEDSK